MTTDVTSSKADFDLAVTFISQSTSLNVPSELKLRLYALYKIATTGLTKSNETRPAFYELTARAKFDAWQQLGAEPGVPSIEEERIAWARSQYVAEAIKLGYVPEQGQSNETLAAERVDLRSQPIKRTTGAGAAVAVSQIADQDVDESIPKSELHELVIDGAVVPLQRFLDEHSTDVDLNAWDAYGFAPLHLAADRGHADIVRILLERGADAECKDGDGNTALELARLSEHDAIISLLQIRSHG